MFATGPDAPMATKVLGVQVAAAVIFTAILNPF